MLVLRVDSHQFKRRSKLGFILVRQDGIGVFMMKRIFQVLGVLLVAAGLFLYWVAPPMSIPLGAIFGAEADTDQLDERIKVPAGFRFTLFASDLSGARFLSSTATGDVLVAERGASQIVLLQRDLSGDGQSAKRRILLADLNSPNDVAYRDGWIYVGEKDAIGRAQFDSEAGEIVGAYERIVTDLPDTGHSAKTIGVSDDGWIYFNVGSSCNVCIEEDDRRSTIMRARLDGSRLEIFASGLRNSAGFDWSPRDGALYATNNGRDLLGDDFPPEELNRIEQGQFYGWPFVHAFDVPDPEFGTQGGALAARAIQPVHTFAAHNAPLGMTFLRTRQYPDDFHHNALVALHGSWNRSEKDGYKVVRLRWGEDGQISQSDFLTGFLRNGDVIGRPVDVEESVDGAIYISDDYTGSVYRLAYQEAGDSTGIAQTEFAKSQIRFSAPPEQIEKGRVLYKTNGCATCHGDMGAQNGDVPLQGLSAKYDAGEVAAILKTPPSSMPAVDMSDEDLASLSAYLLSSE